MNHLRKINASRRSEILAFCDASEASYDVKQLPDYSEYSLPKLKRRITAALSQRWGQGLLETRFELIERERFGGDISLKLPQLLANGGPKVFSRDHVPWIVDVLTGTDFSDVIAKVETKGMYVNLTVTDKWLLSSAQEIIDLESKYGLSDRLIGRRFVVDYSSPNVAKVLHAGHIRSTIIGHVLANLYEACGAVVYRVNHINDFGGFGFVLEGYRRFQNLFPQELSPNERLLEIYAIRRTAERIVQSSASFSEIPDVDRGLIKRYFPDIETTEQLILAFNNYVEASDSRFADLEAGVAEEVDLWSKMIRWSLDDFDTFYDRLNIEFDLVIGESFYFDSGTLVVSECLSNGSAILFTKELAEGEIIAVDEKLSSGEITDGEREIRVKTIRKDIGAIVVQLDAAERFVVLRSDGRSIYSTRDLGAIKLRRELFNPTDIIYVVGQEQKVHFERLFKSAYKIGLADPSNLRFQHLYFGFYIDAGTGKKLSSRDTVANVNQLLAESIAYFRLRLSGRVDQTEGEIDKSAKELSVGSLVFNDLAQDVKGSVSIETEDVNSTIERFEKSGGAYVVYSACRARAILRKCNEKPVQAEEIDDFKIDSQEAALLFKLQEIPERVLDAADQSNPSILVRHLLDTAAIYNSYYARAEVISNGEVNTSRLLITQAVQQALMNGLRLCHVECPEAI